MEKNKVKVRKERVLDIVVRRYIDTTEPIGSRIVSDRMGLSSATVRNIMSDLERSGFIRQPYTSAGRIPTEKGYRFYVNFLMEPEDISAEDKEEIDSIYQSESRSLEDVVEESSHILSYISSLASLVMFPRTKVMDYILKRMENEESARSLINLFYDYDDRLYFDGTHYILEQPEFKNSDRMRFLVKALEEKKVFLNIFKEDLSAQGAKVHIGRENRSSALTQCSIITANYRIRGDAAGTVGVIGPMRMLYRRLVPMVDYLAKAMTNFLNRLV